MTLNDNEICGDKRSNFRFVSLEAKGKGTKAGKGVSRA